MTKNNSVKSWIHSASVDSSFILAPPFLITILILSLQKLLIRFDTFPVWLWAILIIGVDVAHVYSTLFRTYLDKTEFNNRKTLYTVTPLICWVIGTLLYSIDALIFWRAITYFAVFHFVRQQYGFMMIYARHEKNVALYAKKLDRYAIYSSTLYPLIYWHTHLPRQFDWFIAHDFIAINSNVFNQIALVFYGFIMATYLAKEIGFFIKNRCVNWPKNLLLLSTAVSWWVGIIYFNNDIAFTAINVISHGIPYLALIWLYGHNQGKIFPDRKLLDCIRFKHFFSLKMLPFYMGSLLLLAYLEEGLWDGLIWLEHKSLFHAFQSLPTISDKATLAWLIPLLSLPQTTHYALDAFIWRLQTPNTNWKETLFYHQRNL